MIEVFKDVPNYEGIYQVSNFGKVKSLSRIIINRGAKYSCEEKLMKPSKTKNGYLAVSLRKEKVPKTFSIHVLVAMAFLDFIPNGHKFVIDHKNEIKTDNRVENLQIISQRENIQKHHKNKNGSLGCVFHPQAKKWRSEIHINGFNIYLGLFEEKKDALKAYEIANKEIENFENTKQFRTLIKQKIKHYDTAKY